MIDSSMHMVVQSPHFRVKGRRMPDWPALTVDEAAEKSGYHPEYLRRLIRKGRIEAQKFGRMYLIKAESLERYMDETVNTDDSRTGPRRKRD